MTAKAGRANNGSRRKLQRGSSIVEGSFIFLITISMILFIMEVGRFLLTQQYISERARTTARLAVVNNWDTTSIKNYLCYGSTATPAGSPTPTGLMGLTASNISPVWSGSAANGDLRLQISVTGLHVFTFVPMMANNLTAIPVIATAASQSRGATN